jgi:hypothetical protein
MTAILDGEGVCATHHFESAPNKDYLRSCLFEDFNVILIKICIICIQKNQPKEKNHRKYE